MRRGITVAAAVISSVALIGIGAGCGGTDSSAASTPADATTICTRQMACDSVDANRCGCLEGRCSLIPPS